ncbi:porin [Sulfitobacter sp. SK011]|uniref:porin n=1 Tax=Sulfitobacter sp. SK011 TaxID=1389004 RepID=UPI000E0BB1D9|nr:porin [Sulfitobacter sp. SK011]AXI42869.1 hypothetical protein C1J02_13675 [Sulfitobacter sp. SK011]
MKILPLAVFGATSLWMQAAHAVEVTGGSIGLSYSAFTEDTSVSRVGIDGSVELGFNRNISAQVDLGYSDFNITGLNTTTLGLHGIYHVNDATSFGAFYANENANGGGDADIYGIEAGHEAGQFEFEGYLARVDGATSDGDMLGVMARYEFATALGVTGSYDYVDAAGSDFSKLAVKLDRDVAPNVNLYVELGTAKASSGGLSGTEPFVGLGGKFVFGAERGATFEQRGFTRVFPGL